MILLRCIKAQIQRHQTSERGWATEDERDHTHIPGDVGMAVLGQTGRPLLLENLALVEELAPHGLMIHVQDTYKMVHSKSANMNNCIERCKARHTNGG